MQNSVIRSSPRRRRIVGSSRAALQDRRVVGPVLDRAGHVGVLDARPLREAILTQNPSRCAVRLSMARRRNSH
jgi:hypothetical protein